MGRSARNRSPRVRLSPSLGPDLQRVQRWDLTTRTALPDPLDEIERHRNVAVVFRCDLENPGEIDRVLGPSLDPRIDPDHRYLGGVAMILGTDYFVHDSPQLTVEHPPVDPDEGRGLLAIDLDHYWFTRPVFTHVVAGDPPVVDHACEVDGFVGYWKAALCIDCDKDLPALVDDSKQLPERAFVAEIEAAFGTPLIEVGTVY